MNQTRMLPAQSRAEFTITPPYTTNRKSPVRWIASHGWRQAHLILLAIVGAIGNAALTSLVPMVTGQAFNLVLAGPVNLPNLLLTLTLFLAVTQVFRGCLQLARNFGFEVMAQRVEKNVRNELYSSLLGKSMTFHNLQPVGDTMARATNDVREVNFFFSPGLNMVIGSLMFLVLPIYLAPRYHPSLILTPLLFTVLYFVAISFYMRSLEPVTDDVRSSFGALNTRLAEALDGIEVVKGAAQEKGEVQRFIENAMRYRNAFVRQGDIEARFWPLLLFFISLAGGLFHALILYSQGLLSIGDVVAYFGILMMLDFPTFTSIWAYSRLALGLAGARRILELMNRENNLDQNSAGFSGQMEGEVVFDGVDFAYDGSEASLSGMDFKVNPGMTVAVVGQTGSGKTTLARLINRTYDVKRGQVRVDGRDVREWNLESLRRQISIIEQDIFLFSQTIRENIAFGHPEATQEDVEKAARMAQAHDFILTFDKGYDTVIGERGVTLSGGQRQRIALARAFLTDPRILVLDDSTSAIDSATEDLIQRAIFTASRGRTTFIITHRLSQIRWADLILVMRGGQLVAAGTHDELMESSPAYRRIFSE